MNFWQIALTIFTVVLIAGLFWYIKKQLFFYAVGGKKTKVTVIVTSEGSAGELEQSIKGLLWLIDTGSLHSAATILIKDAGMDDETFDMARILARENTSVEF